MQLHGNYINNVESFILLTWELTHKIFMPACTMRTEKVPTKPQHHTDL